MDFRSVGIIGRWVGLAAFTLLVRSGPFLSFFLALGWELSGFAPHCLRGGGGGVFFRGVFPPGRTYKASCIGSKRRFLYGWMDEWGGGGY